MTGTPRLATAAWLALLPCAAPAQPQVLDLDPAHCFVHFEVLHFGTSTLRGRFGPLAGEVQFDAVAGRGRVGLTIDLNTLDTGLKLLDARLRQPDLLDVAAQPTAWFVAERLRFERGLPVELTGEFTLRGVGQALTLTAQQVSCRDGRCGGDFEGWLSRSAFGASFGVPLVADRVHLRVQVEGRLRTPPPVPTVTRAADGQRQPRAAND